MKKRVLALSICLLCALSFVACSDSDDDGFSKDERKVLDFLEGTFYCSSNGETLTFSSFAKPTKKYYSDTKAYVKFDGTLLYTSKHNESECYFYINDSKQQINANGVIEDDENLYSIVGSYVWNYKIVDDNTLQLNNAKTSTLTYYTYIRQ